MIVSNNTMVMLIENHDVDSIPSKNLYVGAICYDTTSCAFLYYSGESWCSERNLKNRILVETLKKL